VQSPSGAPYFFTSTDAAGHYRVDSVPPGSYTVGFSIPPTSLFQYAYGKQFYGDTFPVTAGQTTVVDDRALPTGTITGHFTNAAGQPLAAQVYANSQSGGVGAFGQTDVNGAFSLPVFAGTFIVSFTYGNGIVQYAHGQFDYTKATKYTVAGDATVVIEETALPGGSMSGKVTEIDGSPAAGAMVTVGAVNGSQNLSTTAGPDGTYRFETVPPGTYTVMFSSADGQRHQWANNTTNYWRAAGFTVEVDQNTTVDDQFVGTGTLTVIATDASTGEPLADVCGYLYQGGTEQGQCGDASGKLTFTNVPAGDTYSLSAGTQSDRYLGAQVDDIAIRAGQTTTVNLRVKLAAVIETTALDAKTHQPLADVCVLALPLVGASLPDYEGWCSDTQGKVRIPQLTGGTYTLLARPRDGVHGMQWVGTNGGTGNQFQAHQVQAPSGTVTVAPTIYLDGTGTISGTVTDKDTAKPVPFVCVAAVPVSGYWSRIGSCPGGATDAEGRYTIANLGPYSWPVLFAAPDSDEQGGTYAWQWSGTVTSRKHADLVKVDVGGSTQLNARLSHGTLLQGQILGAGRSAVPIDYYVSAIDPLTGDAAANGTSSQDKNYRIHLLPQDVFLSYGISQPPLRTFWYRGASGFADATAVPIGDHPVYLNLYLTKS